MLTFTQPWRRPFPFILMLPPQHECLLKHTLFSKLTNFRVDVLALLPLAHRRQHLSSETETESEIEEEAGNRDRIGRYVNLAQY